MPAPPGDTVNDVVFTVTENGTDPSLDDVIATIPSTAGPDGKLFERLADPEN